MTSRRRVGRRIREGGGQERKGNYAVCVMGILPKCRRRRFGGESGHFGILCSCSDIYP